MSEHRETKFDERTALVIGKNHPHKGATAVCKGADHTNVGWGMKFKRTDTGEEFPVFNGSEVIWIDNQQEEQK